MAAALETDFQFLLNVEIEKILNDYDEKKHYGLRNYQYLLKEYMIDRLTKHRRRGVLVYHALGAGKTLTSVATALALRRKVLFLSNKTLVDNLKESVKKYAKMNRALNEAEAMDRFNFVTINASNMIQQVERKTGGFALNGLCIILEECQDFFRMVINGSKNAVLLYNAILNTVDLKLIFLSGTPVESNPFSLVPCFNMLAGKRIFPEAEEHFNDLFIEGEFGTETNDGDDVGISLDYETIEQIVTENKIYRVKNEGIFKNRITGLVSYVPKNETDFPELLPIKIVEVPMELRKQLPAYRLAREKEHNEAKRQGKFSKGQYLAPLVQEGIGVKKKKASGSFRAKTRRISNWYEGISPKIDALVADMTASPGKSVAYSQFKENGIDAIAKKLLETGWEELQPKELKLPEEKVGIEDVSDEAVPIGEVPKNIIEETKQKPIKRFIRMSGDLSSQDRLAIIKFFNAKENDNGDYLKTLLFTVVAATGVSLFATLNCFILEPFFHMSRINQVIGRCIRQFSHHMFPLEKRKVQPFLYISVVPKEAEEIFLTSDEILYKLALKRQEIINKFMMMLKEASYDCSAFANRDKNAPKITCHVCRPIPRVPLYGDDIFVDVKEPDPCNKAESEEVKVEKINVNNITYAYTKENDEAKESIYNLAIYKFDTELNVYIRVPEDTDEFGIVRQKIKEREQKN